MCYVMKQMVNATAVHFELWMHLENLLSTQEARVARRDYFCVAISRVHPI